MIKQLKNNTKSSITLKGKEKREAPQNNKRYLKSRPSCKVTFRFPKDAAENAHRVMIVGDFNKWDTEATQLKRTQNGDFSVTLELEKGREYRFRYFIDKVKWENDWHADKYVPNSFGSDDSVVIV